MPSSRFAGLAASFIDGGTPTFLVLPADTGRGGYFVHLNPVLGEAVAAKSLDQVKETIAECHALLLAQPPVMLEDSELGLRAEKVPAA